jgi:hypothetical protein
MYQTEVCSHQHDPDARKARGSQDPTGILAEMPNKGEEVPVETIYRG